MLHLCVRSSLQEFNTSGSSNIDTGKAAGNLETKYKMKELGLTFSQKWNTDNTLATEVTVEDQVCALHPWKPHHLQGGCFQRCLLASS